MAIVRSLTGAIWFPIHAKLSGRNSVCKRLGTKKSMTLALRM